MMRMPTIIATLAVSFLYGACGGTDPNSPMKPTNRISMTADQSFDPEGASVKVGDTVSFTNDSNEAHTVTAYENDIPDGADYFDSGMAKTEVEARKDIAAGLIKEGDTFEVTFKQPGTYRYFCIPHEGAGMKGTIVVEE